MYDTVVPELPKNVTCLLLWNSGSVVLEVGRIIICGCALRPFIPWTKDNDGLESLPSTITPKFFLKSIKFFSSFPVLLSFQPNRCPCSQICRAPGGNGKGRFARSKSTSALSSRLHSISITEGLSSIRLIALMSCSTTRWPSDLMSM